MCVVYINIYTELTRQEAEDKRIVMLMKYNMQNGFLNWGRLREGTGKSSNGTVHLEGGYGWVGRVSLEGLW